MNRLRQFNVESVLIKHFVELKRIITPIRGHNSIPNTTRREPFNCRFWQANSDGGGGGPILRAGGGAHVVGSSTNGAHSHWLTTGDPISGGAAETRPKNIAYPVIIKAW